MQPRITMLTIGVDDLERSVRFYRDGLGFPTKGITGEQSVAVDREGQDRYGRTLARVTVPLLGSRVDAGEAPIREHLALPWVPGAAARIERLNLWCR